MTKKIFSISSAEYPSGNSSLDGLSLDIFFIGCSRPQGHCPGCHNSELWTFKEPNKSWTQLENTVIKASKANIVTLLGGDPTDSMNIALLIKLLSTLKTKFNKKTCIYTYRELEEVPEVILENLDYIKTGFYDENRKTPAGSFLASSNQIMWKKNDGKWTKQWCLGANNNEKSW